MPQHDPHQLYLDVQEERASSDSWGWFVGFFLVLGVIAAAVVIVGDLIIRFIIKPIIYLYDQAGALWLHHPFWVMGLGALGCVGLSALLIARFRRQS